MTRGIFWFTSRYVHRRGGRIIRGLQFFGVICYVVTCNGQTVLNFFYGIYLLSIEVYKGK